MFLKSDYLLMVENSKKMADSWRDRAGGYTEEAAYSFGETRNRCLELAASFVERAAQHDRDAEYWRGFVREQQEA